jgi:hypothetical protein
MYKSPGFYFVYPFTASPPENRLQGLPNERKTRCRPAQLSECQSASGMSLKLQVAGPSLQEDISLTTDTAKDFVVACSFPPMQTEHTAVGSIVVDTD